LDLGGDNRLLLLVRASFFFLNLLFFLADSLALFLSVDDVGR
jgi:hypothetical protein